MLQLRNLMVRVAGRVLIEDATVAVPAGHKVGLVGRNGTGKSTLLRVLAGELAADAGAVEIGSRTRIGWVAQEMPPAELTPLDFVLAADTERAALLAAAERAHDPDEIAHVHTRLAEIGAEAAPARAARILAGLGFDEAAQARPLGSFSGGWRMRAALAATLFLEPDLLLLDEPSNHLDLETRVWLEGHLQQYPGTFVMVSHDRELLNAVTDSILHLHAGTLTLYRGNYDRFERTARERAERREALIEQQKAKRAHLQAFVDRFRAKATKARQAQSRLKMLARMEEIAPIVTDPDVRFGFPDPQGLPSPLVTIDRASVGYDGRPVLRGLNLSLGADDRVALLGANGNGKTTLLKLLMGALAPLSGEIVRAPRLAVGYFEQEQADAFDPAETPLIVMSRIMGRPPEAKARGHLGRFGFGQERALTRIGDLSGGEKARLLFACITWAAPHVLLLDEPTNHLDIEAREALIEALNDFKGAVVLVTHDPYLVETTADRLWLVKDGACQPFDGDLDDYRRLLREERRAERRENRAEAAERAGRRDDRRARAAGRAETAHLRRAARDAEAAVDRLGREKASVEAKLADPALYSGDVTEIERLNRRLAEITSAIETAESAWLEAQEALEAAS